MIITKTEYPTLFKALSIICHGCGAGSSIGWYDASRGWHNRLPVIEHQLSLLNEAALQTFSIGEDNERERMVESWPDLEPASEFLDEFFQYLLEMDAAE